MQQRPGILAAAAALSLGLATGAAHADAPRYTIVDLGVVGTDTASQAFNISPDGDTVVGRSFGTGTQRATSWTASGGLVALPNLAGRNFAVANAVNSAGVVVGNSTTTSFGSGALPVTWTNGVITALTMPPSQTVGRANDINSAGVVVGSVNAGNLETATIYSGGSATLITATTSGGSFMRTAFGINDSGLVAGNGIDPTNAARNVGLVYNSTTGTMTDIGALAGANGALAFDISNAGHVVGSSMLNQGSGRPYIWTPAGGMVEIALPTGTSQGSARSVNSAGWVVGNSSSAFSIPFLYDGTATYRLADLLPTGSGWDFLTNTSASALGISENGSIVGTAVINGQTHGYLMLLSAVPEPGTWALMLGGAALLGGAARRQRG